MGSISDKLTYLNATKAAIKQAIINKGVAVADTDTFRSYAEKISSIETEGPAIAVTDASVTYTSNGTYTVEPDENNDYLSSVLVTVNVPYSTYYTGTSDPSSSLGSNGDLYLKTS